MKEQATVVSIKNKFAQVKVTPAFSCHECSARSLCIGQKQKDGTLTVLNPISAKPGDEVTLQIPEESYSKELILIFSILLAGIFTGVILGNLFSILLGWPTTATSLAGVFIGLAAGSFLIFRHLHRTKKSKLYPVIINIAKKGGSHG